MPAGWELLLNSIGGAVAGYFTNYFAIKMLFRRYGPFGGYILKTRDEFIDNISQLMEKRIINHRTIEGELTGEEFEKILNKTIFDILDNYLYDYIENKKWGDIPGIEDTAGNFHEFMQDNIKYYLYEGIEILSEEIDINDLISDKQLEVLSNELLQISLDTLKESNTIGLMIEDIMENHGQDFMTPRLEDVIKGEMTGAFDDFSKEVINEYSADIREIFNDVWDYLELNKEFKILLDNLNDKSIYQLAGFDSSRELSQKIENSLIDFLLTDEGKEFIDKFWGKLINILENTDISLFTLFDDRVQTNLEIYLKRELPDVIDKGLVWLYQHKEEIEELIESSLEDVLESGRGVRNILKRLLYNTFKGRVKDELAVVDNLIISLETGEEKREELINELTEKIIYFFKKKKISEIIMNLEQKGIINETKAPEIIINKLKGLKNNMDLSFFEQFLSASLAPIFAYIEEEKLIKEFKITLFEILWNNNFFIDNLAEIIKDKLNDNGMASLNNKKLYGFILHILENKKQRLTVWLKEILSLVLRKINHPLNTEDGNSLKEKLSTQLADLAKDNLISSINEFQNEDISYRLDKLNKEELSSSLSEFLLELLDNNLEEILGGRIQQTVSDSLHQLDDKSIQSSVEDFMGTELQPITWLGAGLGGIVGILLYILVGNIDINITPPVGMGLSSFIYGFIGFLTNVIALRMIFRPYNKKEFLGINIPFTPGVVAKNKPRFASAMGNFVDQELLNANTVSDIFKGKREEIENNLRKVISDNDFQLVYQLLNDNTKLFARRLFAGGVYYIHHSEREVAEKLVSRFADLKLREFNIEEIKENLTADEKLTQDIIKYFSQRLQNKLSEVDDLEKLINEWEDNIKKGISILAEEKLGEMAGRLKKGDFKEDINYFSPHLNKIKDKKLTDIMGNRQKNKLLNLTVYFVEKTLNSPEFKTKLLDNLENNLISSPGSKKGIGSVFQGKFFSYLFENRDNLVYQILKTGLEWLQSEGREVIKNEVVRMVNGEIEGGLSQAIYQFTDTEKTIRKVVDDLVDNKIPPYLSEQRAELDEILSDFLDRLSNSNPEEFGLYLNRESIGDFIDQILNNEEVMDTVNSFVSDFADSIMEVNIETLLNILSASSLEDIYDKYHKEIDRILKSVGEKLTDNMDKLRETTFPFLEDMGFILLKNIVCRLQEKDIKDELFQLLASLPEKTKGGNLFKGSFEAFLEDLLHNAGDKKLEDFFDIEELGEKFTEILYYLLYDKDLRNRFHQLLSKIIGDISDKLQEIVAEDSREFFLTVILGSSLDGLQEHFQQIINTVDFKNITDREIDEMNAAEIEKLFQGFAGHYLTRLKLYGWVGGIFGLAAYLLGSVI
ncbi:MAG: DUF445 family protein [Halanaerobiales bacterium]